MRAITATNTTTTISTTFTTYILKCSDQTLYIGSTNNLAHRLHAHNHLKSGARYTRARRPVKLFYQENFSTMTEAKKREAALKKLTRQEKLNLRAKILKYT